jgi:hypothetical protein
MDFPKFDNKSDYALIPEQVFDAITLLDKADAIIVYLNFFVLYEYSFNHKTKLKITIGEVASGLGWSMERADTACEYLLNKEFIIQVGDNAEFRLNTKIEAPEKVEKEKDELYPLKIKAINLLMEYSPVKNPTGGIPGNLNQINQNILLCKKPENVEIYLNDLCTAIVYEARKGVPKDNIKWFSPQNVYRIMGEIKQKKIDMTNGNTKRGAIFNFEILDSIHKKVNSCYETYTLAPERTSEEEQIQKVVDYIKRLLEKRGLHIDEAAIRKEAETAWAKKVAE